MSIKVKLFGVYSAAARRRQFPGDQPTWGNCEFTFDLDCRDYDWLVIYSDLPSDHPREELACPRQHTLLVTTEPSTIKIYGRDYTAQFGHVLTSQPEWALPHAHRIHSQPALQWFYGAGGSCLLSFDDMMNNPPIHKTRDISTVCSIKQQRHTLHNKRYKFTESIKKIIPEMDIYGHGVKHINDKAEALDKYRYHLVIENFIGKHHWTEKISDAFLGITLPFYYGCTNLEDYFPSQSYISIDINDVKSSAEIIKKSIRDNEFEKRLPHIMEARRRVLEEYNLFAVLSRIIESNHHSAAPSGEAGIIRSIHELRRCSSSVALRHFFEKCRQRAYYLRNYFD